MPIGPITPGSPTTVTADVLPPAYASIQGPSPSMPVVAQDILDLSLVVMNVQDYARKAELDASEEIPLHSQQVQIVQRSPWIVQTQGPGDAGWYPEDTVATIGGEGPMGPIQFDNSAGFGIKKMLDLPHGCLLNQIQFGVLGVGHTIAPDNPPAFFVFKKRLSDGLVEIILSNADTAPMPSYDTYRGIQVPYPSTTSIPISNTDHEYWVLVTGEHGTNSVAFGYIIVYVDALVTIANVDKRAS